MCLFRMTQRLSPWKIRLHRGNQAASPAAGSRVVQNDSLPVTDRTAKAVLPGSSRIVCSAKKRDPLLQGEIPHNTLPDLRPPRRCFHGAACCFRPFLTERGRYIYRIANSFQEFKEKFRKCRIVSEVWGCGRGHGSSPLSDWISAGRSPHWEKCNR